MTYTAILIHIHIIWYHKETLKIIHVPAPDLQIWRHAVTLIHKLHELYPPNFRRMHIHIIKFHDFSVVSAGWLIFFKGLMAHLRIFCLFQANHLSKVGEKWSTSRKTSCSIQFYETDHLTHICMAATDVSGTKRVLFDRKFTQGRLKGQVLIRNDHFSICYWYQTSQIQMRTLTFEFPLSFITLNSALSSVNLNKCKFT